jgi:hypothetical protein
MEYEASERAAAAAARKWSYGLEQAGQVAELLWRTARALDASAALAEQHAERREVEGRAESAKAERAAGRKASDAAQRARARATELLELSRLPRVGAPPGA